MCSSDRKKDSVENKVDKDSHWGATMQHLEQLDQDLILSLDAGDLPDDLSEFFSEDCLKTIDPDVLFGDPWLNFGEEIISSDTGVPTEPPSRDRPQQSQSDERRDKTNNRRKRLRAPRSQRGDDENTPTRPKRHRAAGRLKTKEAQADSPVSKGTDTGSEPSPAEITSIPTSPPRILHLHPSIQFITIPEAPRYHVVQTLSISPPVLGLPLPNTAAAPTYILVPATSPPPSTHQLPPHSPVGGAVAPIQMSSSPPGSQSDSASKAMSPRVASPLSPSCESSPCKESSHPQSPTIPEVPGAVKDYIQEAKAYMSQSCQDMGAGLNLASHYVEVQVSQREICSGKNTNKSLDKEMLSIGSMTRQKSMLRGDQIFEGLNGNKPRRYMLLLGGAGVGKTTLIKKLCLDWSKDRFPQFDFVFLLDGKGLALREANFSLQTLLLNYSSFVPSCTEPEEVYAQVLAAPKRVLVIFDGFDEMRDYETLLQTQERDLVASLQKDSKAQSYTVRQLYSGILQRVLLPGCTLLLSTRPRGTANQLLRRADSLLEMCGFTPGDVETYLSQYFTDSALRETVLDYLKNCSYLQLLCWIPGLCQLVCLVLEHVKSSEELPRTFTALCHQVLHLTLEKDRRSSHPQAEVQTYLSAPSVEEAQPQISRSSQQNSTRTKSGSKACYQSRTQRASRAKKHKKRGGVCGEESSNEMDRAKERELLSQLSSLAWEGVKASSSHLPTGRTISAKLRAFGQRMGLLLPFHLKRREMTSSEEAEEREDSRKGRQMVNSCDSDDDFFLSWANPFLQSYLAGVHLALSRTVSDRIFLQALPFQSGPKGRRRPQREELELTQRFAVGLLFHDHRELQGLHSYTETAFRDMVDSKQTVLQKHLESLSHGDLSPAQVLEACHCVYEAGKGSMDSCGSPLAAHLAVNLPEVLSFHGVPLTPPDVYTLQNVLERGRSEGRCFCLDLENSGIQISGLRALVGLSNINTYRACIADVITFWEQLAQRGEEELLQRAVSRFKIHPLKATQVCHIEHLAKLVNIHMLKRLSDSSNQSDSIFEDGVPAVRELHKLEFELGPENGPLVLPRLWELLPGLHNLQHLDLENSKIGDKGAEKLADALVSLSNLEILNLSQNCIGDQGVTKLAEALKDLPKLHCLSLYSNVISDEGAEGLASILPQMASLSELDVKYNKFTDAGAQSLAVSLKSCKKMKTLRMWNQCVPYGALERLKQQDSRIAWH
ncbi:MHC class II transactivator [Halichoeres trimaculatus]|uniref:MHC class II transactivator n=1 Tax=Halichoeres trimaculatus TaxID=147232 RepID=UPI003D9F2CCC